MHTIGYQGWDKVTRCATSQGHVQHRLSKIPKITRRRAVRYDDIYRMDEIKSLSFHILLYRLFRGVAKYIVYGNTFSSFG